MRHLYFCPKCGHGVITKTEIPPDKPNVICTCSLQGAIDCGTFPEDWSDEQCCEFVNNKIIGSMEKYIIEGDTFADLQPVGMPRTEAQQAGMFVTSDGEEITVTKGTEGFPQVPGNDLPSNLQCAMGRGSGKIKTIARWGTNPKR